MKTRITKKAYEGIYRKIKASDLKSNIHLYNQALVSNAKAIEDIYFLVYEDDNCLQSDKEYWIDGIGYREHFWCLRGAKQFLYLVELLDDELYYQNSGSGHIKGKVIEKKKYKINFNRQQMEAHANTFLDFISLIGYSTENTNLEEFAIQCCNIKLLENIFRYKYIHCEGNPYDRYTPNDFKQFKKIVIKNIKITNIYREQLLSDLKQITDFKELGNYIKRNKEKILDRSDLMYTRNDNVKNFYPTNMAGGIVRLDLYDGLEFNSAMPFYFQYRNYQLSVQILADKFFSEIVDGENKKIKNSIKMMKWYYKEDERDKEGIPELSEVNTVFYGLYFPLFMNFRQSIELAFKLIFINEDLKKQTFVSKEELNEYAQKINTHDLPQLLQTIEQYLDSDVNLFLMQLSSFVYYNEGTDASFSRYLIDNKLDFNALLPMWIYFEDLYHYINEFYAVMEEVFESINFGFDLNNVFTK